MSLAVAISLLSTGVDNMGAGHCACFCSVIVRGRVARMVLVMKKRVLQCSVFGNSTNSHQIRQNWNRRFQ